MERDAVGLDLQHLRGLHGILAASETIEGLRFSWHESNPHRLFITSAPEHSEFEADLWQTSIRHELPVNPLSPQALDSYFREPLIPNPSITFTLPQATSLHEKVGRLSRHAGAASMAANYSGRLLIEATGSLLQAQVAFTGVQCIKPHSPPNDVYELICINLSLSSLTRVLACFSALQTPVLAAIASGESVILSTKIPNPCGPDRPSGSFSIILAAYEPS